MAALSIPQTGAASSPQGTSTPASERRGLAAPALLAAVSFAGGILVAQFRWIQPAHLLLAILWLIVTTTVAAMRAPRLSFGSAALLCLLLGVFCAEVQPRPPATTPLLRIAEATPTPTPALHRRGISTGHAIEGGILRTGPVRVLASLAPYSEKARQERSQQVDVRVGMVDGVPLPSPEGLRLTLYAPAEGAFPRAACGSFVRAVVEMHSQERFLDPDVWDAGAWLRQQGISAVGSAHAQNVSFARGEPRGEPGFLSSCRLRAVQEAVSERLASFAEQPGPRWIPAAARLTHEDGAMLTAMLTGDRSRLGHRLRAGFERTGSFHLLVVSGMHLAIFSGVVFWIARRLRLPRAAASLATIALSLAYALFTGFGQPVQRAFWMIALYLTGRLLWRERHPLNAVGFAALVILVVNPGALLDAGFQMTLLSVLAVAGIAAPVAEKSFGPYLRAPNDLPLLAIDSHLPPDVAQFRVSLRMIVQSLRPLTGPVIADRILPGCVRLSLTLMELFTTSMAIELLMALPMAIYFHRITAVALPVNVFIVPLLSLLLPLALLTMALVLLAQKVAVIPGVAVALLLHGVSHLVRVFGVMSVGDLRIPVPPALTIAAVIALTAASLFVIRLRRHGMAAAGGILVLAVALSVWPRQVSHRAGTLEVSAIDVGQGDSLLVITPHGKTLLIDAGGLVGASGPNSPASDQADRNFDIGDDVVSPVLWSRGIRRLDAVAITHAHADHIGGMPAILANFRPRELWVGINPHAPLYEATLADARANRTRLVRHTAGDVFSFDEVRIRVLAPEASYQPAALPGNNDSLVLQVSYGRTSALLEGDAEAPSEQRMLAEGGLHADFLKVGHHGSRTSTTPAFLAAVSPAYAAISVGRRNFYGHPRHEVLEELQQAHVRTFRTDLLGLSTVYLDGNRVTTGLWTER